MIDFTSNSVVSLCQPTRMYRKKLSPRLRDEVLEICIEQADQADEYIQNKQYDKAIKTLSEIIESLEMLQQNIESDHKKTYLYTYEQVDKQDGYHNAISNVAGEHGEQPCTLGALKSAKADLEKQSF